MADESTDLESAYEYIDSALDDLHDLRDVACAYPESQEREPGHGQPRVTNAPEPSERRHWAGHRDVTRAIELHRLAEIEQLAAHMRRRSKIRVCSSWDEWT